MTRVIPFPDRTRIKQAAAAWLARLDRGGLDEAEKDQLRQWLAAAPSHRHALEQLAQLWGDLDCMSILAELFPLGAEPPRKPWKQWIPAGAMGAVVMVMLTAGLFFAGFFNGYLPLSGPAGQATPSELVYRTERGQQSEIRLQDGSQLVLNTHSEARIRFDDQIRAVYLSYGEAHFEVAKSSTRPFVVHAGHGQVRAVGTAFNVKLLNQRVEVLVREGVVEVLTRPETISSDNLANLHAQSRGTAKLLSDHLVGPADRVVLTQGGSASYVNSIAPAPALSVEKVEQRLAWRRGKWLFEGETLAEVVADVSRYTDQHITIVDPQIANLRVGGYFDIGDIEGLMAALSEGLGIAVAREGDRYLLGAGLNSKG